MKNLFIFIFAAFIGLGSCAPPKNAASDQLTFREKSEELQRCLGDACARMYLSYPLFEGDTLLAKPLNDQVNRQLIYFMQLEGQESLSLQDAIQDFFADYIKLRKETAVPVQEWTLEITGRVTFQSENLLGLRFSSYSFLGGAHPNSQELHVTFDLEEGGRLLSQKDMVLKSDKLLELALKKFRDFHQVESGVSLKEDGRFFLNKKGFFLPQSMGYEQDDFVLLYNPYEIGPYAMGSTELKIPLKNLEGIVLTK